MNINEIFAHVDELFENKRANEVEPYLLSCLAEAEAARRPGADTYMQRAGRIIQSDRRL